MKKILIILSSDHRITLKNGHRHPTGFFLSELMEPVKALREAGHQLVFANPEGTPAAMDAVSDRASWFRDENAYREIRALLDELGLLRRPLAKLSDVVREGLDEYAGVFFPGGHAPMERLWHDPDVREVFRHFHRTGKPTALLCHAPTVLIAALDNPPAYVQALRADDREAMVEQSKNWIYRDYRMTVFTTREEQQEEPGQDNVLGGFMPFYPDAALEHAGGNVRRGEKWTNQVVQDRELITGQNPFSHQELAEKLLAAIG